MQGLRDATIDRIRIERFWERWPDANLGIVTGIRSGLLVLDVDDNDGRTGSANLAAMSAPFGGIPSTLTAITGNGHHLFFEHLGTPISSSRGKVAEGVDIRGDRGYVVAAPSLHRSGKRYSWKDPEQGLAMLPDWLLARMLTS
jgi:Bifunctional DNA primase/polymerase, N-terminal